MMRRLVGHVRRDRYDDGAALIFALVIVLVAIILLTGTLAFAQSRLTTSIGFRTHSNTTLYTDGAMDGAINALRGNPTLGAVGGSCPTYTPQSPPSSDIGADTSTYTVTCQPATTDSGSTPANQPAYAIMTLAKDPAGNSFTVDKNNALSVDGSIYSNGKIHGGSGNPSITDFGNVTATDACDLPVTATGAVSCLSSNPPVADPNYASAVDTSQSPLDALPACSGESAPYQCADPTPTCATSSSVVAFSPGLYTQVPEAPSGCNGSLWWFQPGVYYFDFTNGSPIWTPNEDIVGGTPKNFSATSTTATFPNACDRTATNGVQFIFGGDSQLVAPNGGSQNFELCSSTSTTQQEIVLYALKADGGGGDSVLDRDLHPATVTSTGGSAYNSVPPASSLSDALNDIDGKSAAATLAGSGGNATVTATDYDTIPSGATISALSLRFKHIEVNASPSVAVTWGGKSISSFNPNTASFCSHASGVDDCDILNKLPDDYPYRALDGTDPKLSVAYKATAGPGGGSSTVDGMNVRVSYNKAGFAATTCLATASCNVVDDGSPGGGGAPHLVLLFHGTVYTPTSGLSVVIMTAGTTIFDRGVISGTLLAHISAGSQQTVAPFALPRATSNRAVLFTVNVNGIPKLRALVTYKDFQPNPTFPEGKVAFPGFGVLVTNWSVLR